jgi:hypothetical protein
VRARMGEDVGIDKTEWKIETAVTSELSGTRMQLV